MGATVGLGLAPRSTPRSWSKGLSLRHVPIPAVPRHVPLALWLATGLWVAGLAGCGDPPPPPGVPRDLGPDTSWLDPDTCEQLSVQATREPPSVLILLDRSGSMYDPPLDRWTPAVSAINQVVGTHASTVEFGLGLFGEGDSCGNGRIRVNPGADTADTIASQLSGDPAVRTGGGTPTAAMLQRAATQLSTEVQRRALALATLLEPLLIVGMGLVVMLIVLAVLLPIIQLNQWVK